MAVADEIELSRALRHQQHRRKGRGPRKDAASRLDILDSRQFHVTKENPRRSCDTRQSLRNICRKKAKLEGNLQKREKNGLKVDWRIHIRD